jgi:hypothetical protein
MDVNIQISPYDGSSKPRPQDQLFVVQHDSTGQPLPPTITPALHVSTGINDPVPYLAITTTITNAPEAEDENPPDICPITVLIDTNSVDITIPGTSDETGLRIEYWDGKIQAFIYHPDFNRVTDLQSTNEGYVKVVVTENLPAFLASYTAEHPNP